MAYRENGPSFLWGLNQFLPPQQTTAPGLDAFSAPVANQAPFLPAAPASPDMAQFSDQLAMWTTASFSFDGPMGHALVADEDKDSKKDLSDSRDAGPSESPLGAPAEPDHDAERERRLDRERVRIHQEHSRLSQSQGQGQQAPAGASLWQRLEALSSQNSRSQAPSPRAQEAHAQTQDAPQVQQLLASLEPGNPLALLQVNQLLSSLGALGQTPSLPGLDGLSQLGALGQLGALQGLVGAQQEHASPQQTQAPLLSLLQSLGASQPPAAQNPLLQLLAQTPQMPHPPAAQQPTGPPAWLAERAGLTTHGASNAPSLTPGVLGPVQAPVPSPEEFTSQRPSRSNSPARAPAPKKRRSESRKGDARRPSSSDSVGSDSGSSRARKSGPPAPETVPRPDIDQDNIPPLVLIDTGNPEADAEANRLAIEEDKRRRNTAASARFRFKKKQREAALEARHKELRDRVAQLEASNAKLVSENEWLRSFFSTPPSREGEAGVLASPTDASGESVPEKPAAAAGTTLLGYKREREDD